MGANKQQVKVIKLAPDALVYINANQYISNSEQKWNIRDYLIDINTDLSTESVPGSAGFTLSIPLHTFSYTQITQMSKFGKSFSEKLKLINVMDEVEIYIKGRYAIKNEKGQEYPYYRVFWGVVTSTVDQYSDGTYSIQVSCADILRWWEITFENVSPAVTNLQDEYTGLKDAKRMLTEGKTDQTIRQGELTGSQGDKLELTQFKTKFAGMNIAQILIELSRMTMGNLVPIANSFDRNIGIGSATTDNADQVKTELADATSLNYELMTYWRERFNQMGQRLRIFGVKNVEPIPKENRISGVSVKFDFDKENFTSTIPYTLETQSPSDTDAEMKSKLDIARELKDSVQFEFYMDVNGDIIFKPPFYNMNVIANPTCVLEDQDIINYSFNTNESQIITRVDVTGDFINQLNSAVGGKVLKGIWIDFEKAKKYGMRSTTRHIQWLNNNKDLLKYAQAEMSRLNALARTGDITIVGRPELRLGYPVYFPSRDSFYYVQGIQHSFTFGSSFTTSLTLVAERIKKSDRWQVQRNTGLVEDKPANTEGSSVADTVSNSDNFIQQLYDVCIAKRNELPATIQPSYANTLDNIASNEIGNYQSFSNVPLSDDNDVTHQYQTTDGEMYELITPFKYGMGMNYAADGNIDNKANLEKNKLNKAWAAYDLNPNQLELEIQPLNSMFTLNKLTNDGRPEQLGMLSKDSKDSKDLAMLISDITVEPTDERLA